MDSGAESRTMAARQRAAWVGTDVDRISLEGSSGGTIPAGVHDAAAIAAGAVVQPGVQRQGRAWAARQLLLLFEALIKLSACPLAACYVRGRREGAPREEKLDQLLLPLAFPSLGQWMGILREMARHYGSLPDAASSGAGSMRAR